MKLQDKTRVRLFFTVCIATRALLIYFVHRTRGRKDNVRLILGLALAVMAAGFMYVQITQPPTGTGGERYWVSGLHSATYASAALFLIFAEPTSFIPEIILAADLLIGIITVSIHYTRNLPPGSSVLSIF